MEQEGTSKRQENFAGMRSGRKVMFPPVGKAAMEGEMEGERASERAGERELGGMFLA